MTLLYDAELEVRSDAFRDVILILDGIEKREAHIASLEEKLTARPAPLLRVVNTVRPLHRSRTRNAVASQIMRERQRLALAHARLVARWAALAPDEVADLKALGLRWATVHAWVSFLTA